MPAPLILAGLAAGGFVKGGGLGGIIGSGARKREEQAARVEKRERQYDYENFDYNQDVGPINNPYAEVAQQQQDFLQQNLDRSAANAIDASQRAGNAGAAQYAAFRQTDQAAQQAQSLQSIRATGAQYVERQRQARIADKFDQSQTLLSAASQRLDIAQKARKRATEAIFKGIGSGVTAAAGGLSAGGGLSAIKGGTFDGAAAFKGSGLLPQIAKSDSELTSGSTGGAFNFSEFIGGGPNTDLGIGNQNHVLGVQNANPTTMALTEKRGFTGYADPVTGEFNEYAKQF